MRNIERIDRITNKLNKLWKQYPDFRFYQLLQILEIPKEKLSTDPFFWEDNIWEAMIDETTKEN